MLPSIRSNSGESQDRREIEELEATIRSMDLMIAQLTSEYALQKTEHEKKTFKMFNRLEAEEKWTAHLLARLQKAEYEGKDMRVMGDLIAIEVSRLLRFKRLEEEREKARLLDDRIAAEIARGPPVEKGAGAARRDEKVKSGDRRRLVVRHNTVMPCPRMSCTVKCQEAQNEG